MFRLIQSNSIETLAAALAEQLLANTPEDPFAVQKVLVSTNAMGRWLALALSEQLGICAGIDFDFGGRYLRNLVRQLAAQPSDIADPWEPEQLRWHLAQMLPQIPASHHWQNNSQLNRQQLQFLLQLSDTLDQYGLYRPAAIRRWLAAENLDFDAKPLEASELWQAQLLRNLQNKAKALGFDHPSERLLHAPQRLAKAEELFEQWQQEGPLHVFGLSSLAPAFWQLLATIAASGRRDVVLYLLSPCNAPWGAMPPPISNETSAVEQLETMLLYKGHPLLANLGRTLRDFDWQLELISTNLEEKFQRHSLPSPPLKEGAMLLDQLKHDLATGLKANPLELKPEQLNLQIIHCHGDRRQVEEAHEAVLALMARDPSLQPHQVLLLTTDVACFAPLVLATFEQPGGSSNPRHLPIRVTDRTLRQRNPQINLLFQLLALAGSRYEREAVLDLLLLPPVAQAMQLIDLEHHQWLHLIQAVGITWGKDGNHRQQWGYPAGGENSWQWGLDRLLLGLLIEDPFPAEAAALGEWQGIAAHGDPLLTAALVQSLIKACETLFGLLRRLEAPLAPGAWAEALADAVQGLSNSAGLNGWQAPELYELLKPLRTAQQIFNTQEIFNTHENAPLLEREAVVLLLEEAEAQEQGRYGHVSGAVSLSALEPMRSIPHRVVVLLGMDEERLPRQDNFANYNLMARNPWRGDRSRRQEDRAILLETLQACRHHWIATYTGTDPRTGEEQNPAGPLADLISCLTTQYRCSDGSAIKDLLVRRAPPLRPLPSAPINGLEALWPANLDWPATETASSDLSELQLFFSDPARGFLRAHGIQLQRKPEQAWDPEETELDGLHRWQICEQMLPLGIDGLSPAAWQQQQEALKRRGKLPSGPAAQVVSANLRQRSLALLQIDQQLQQSQPNSQRIISSGVLNAKRKLQAWIAHLDANQTKPRTTYLIGPKASGEQEELISLCLDPIDSATANKHLALLHKLHQEGLSRPLPFEPEASWLLLNYRQNPEANWNQLDDYQWPDSIIQLNRGEAPNLFSWWDQADCLNLAEQILIPLDEALAASKIS